MPVLSVRIGDAEKDLLRSIANQEGFEHLSTLARAAIWDMLEDYQENENIDLPENVDKKHQRERLKESNSVNMDEIYFKSRVRNDLNNMLTTDPIPDPEIVYRNYIQSRITEANEIFDRDDLSDYVKDEFKRYLDEYGPRKNGMNQMRGDIDGRKL